MFTRTVLSKLKFTVPLKFISIALIPHATFLLLFYNLLERSHVLVDLLLEDSFS